jgi:uncharacterized protein YidB (DUF937 family)
VPLASAEGRHFNCKGTWIMGLLDNVLGSAVPGGRYAKPLGIALLALLAARASGRGGFGAGGRGGADEGGGGGLVAGGGGLGGLLSGGLGGLLGGLMGGTGGDTRTMPNQDQAHAAMSGGLDELLQRFQQSGYGDIVNSWIGTGSNRPVAPDQLNQALSPETVDELSQQTGVPRHEVLSELSQALPTMVDRLTPEGRIPDQQEMARWQPR